MKKVILFALSSLLFSGCSADGLLAQDDADVIDRVVASIGCGSERKLITKSEVGSPDIFKNMEPSTLESLIEQKIIVLEAERFKIANFTISVSPAEIDSRLERAKGYFGAPGIANNKFEKLLLEKGTSIEALRDQVYNAGMISHLMNFMFPEKTAVSSDKIEQYYKENPVFEEEEVHLQAAEVTPEKLEQVRLECVSADGQARKHELEKLVDMCDLGFVKSSQLQAQTRKSIDSLKQSGQVFIPEALKDAGDEKLTIFRLVERRPRREKTLEERKVEISQILQGSEKDRKYKAYLEELKSQTHVRVFE